MTVIRVIVALLALLLAGQAGAHPPGVRDEDQAVAHEVEALREELKRAVERKDAALLRAMYSDSFTHTHGSGRVDGKDARIVSALAGDPVIETAPVTELNYRVFGDHTIVVTGKPDLQQGRQPQLRFSLAVGLRKDRRPLAARRQPGDASALRPGQDLSPRRNPARRNLCGSTASPSMRVS